MDFCGLDRPGGLRAVELYREYYREKGIWENQVYAGIPELLAQLRSAGRKLLVATSKPEEFAHQILEHFHLSPYFDFVSGASMDSRRVRKADVIARALAHEGLTPGRRWSWWGTGNTTCWGPGRRGWTAWGCYSVTAAAPSWRRPGPRKSPPPSRSWRASCWRCGP